MKTKHTKGPWEAMIPQVARCDDDFDVDGDNGNCTVAHVCTGRDILTAKANARLIAAAPELLEACEAAMAFLSNHRVEQNIADAALTVMKARPVLAALESAIAKATPVEQGAVK